MGHSSLAMKIAMFNFTATSLWPLSSLFFVPFQKLLVIDDCDTHSRLACMAMRAHKINDHCLLHEFGWFPFLRNCIEKETVIFRLLLALQGKCYTLWSCLLLKTPTKETVLWKEFPLLSGSRRWWCRLFDVLAIHIIIVVKSSFFWSSFLKYLTG